MKQAPPELSPDGRFYWDGEKWQPMPASAPASAPAQVQQVQVRGQMPTWAAVAGLVLMPPIGLIMVGFTPWRVTSKVIAAGAAILGWVILLAALRA